MRRGEVYWACLEPRSGSEQRGRRPVVVISHDAFNLAAGWKSVIVVPLTTSVRQGRRHPTVVVLPSAHTGLPEDSLALCHQITTLDRAKLTDLIAVLGQQHMRAIGQAVLDACDIDALVR